MKKKKKIINFIFYSVLVIVIAGGAGYAINAYRWKPFHDDLRDTIEKLKKETQGKEKEQIKWDGQRFVYSFID